MDSIYKVGRGKRASRRAESTTEKKNPGLMRMQMDMSELDLPENCSISLDDKANLMTFTITIKATEGYWKGVPYTFRFKIPDNYPHKPPKVVCETKIYHPNIDLNGAVCLNLLKDDWRPILNTQNIVHGLLFLLLEPNPADPLNLEAAAVLREDPAKFKRNVQRSLRGDTVEGTPFPRLK